MDSLRADVRNAANHTRRAPTSAVFENNKNSTLGIIRNNNRLRFPTSTVNLI